jgi:hypothetical protein
MIRYCNARMCGGKRCRKPALTGKLRCRTHGSLGSRPPGIQLRASHNDALQAGRARWVARMPAAKAQGQVGRFPGGKPPRGSAPQSKDKTIARAQRIVRNLITAGRNSLLPGPGSGTAAAALPPRPLTKADKHSAATDLAY